MASRAAGSYPPASSGSSAPPASSATTASRIRRWISRSEGMARSRDEGALRHGVGARGLRQDDVERGHVVVPLDQGWLSSEAFQRVRVERPDRLGDPAAMGVDQDFATALLRLGRETAKMQLRNRLGWKLGDVAIAIEAEIMCAQIDVAHVTEEPAAGAVNELGQELDLRHGRSIEADIARWVLDQVLSPERVLHLVDMRADDAQRFPGVGQWQQIVEILARMRRPGEGARHEDRINQIDQRSHTGQMQPVDAARAADRDTDRVNGDRVVACDVDEQLGGVRIGEEILRMDLEPRCGRAGGYDVGEMREPQPHT